MKIHVGDVVTVITGKDKGKQGTVSRVLPTKSRVVVEGINMRIRHIKKTAQQAGQRVSYEASIHVSNVMILDPKSKKPTRIGYKVDPKTGNKSRIAKASGEVITKAVTKAEKPATKGVAKKDGAKADTKQPFWKRGADVKSQDGTSGARGEGADNAINSAHRSQGG